jgi:outer membrane protein assembly factor BamB
VFALIANRAAADEDWPRFRGPSGQGTVTGKAPPTEWSASKNLRWKTELPGEGWSSPIVAGGRIFLTAATEEGRSCRLLIVDPATGRLEKNVEVHRQKTRRKEGQNSWATSTPVSDGRRVFVTYADGAVFGLSLAGEKLWDNREVSFFSKHGMGASPIIAGGLVIVPFDGSSDGDELEIGWKKPWEGAVILALDPATGKTVWRGKRGLSRVAHVTPNVVRDGDRELLVSGAGDRVQAFDLRGGEMVWSIHSQGEGVVPSIVVGDGIIYSASGFEAPTIRAVRLGGRGDVTKTHLAWEQRTGVPSMVSFALVGNRLFSVSEAGVANCFDAATGKLLGRQRLGGNHSASPVASGDRLWFFAEDGSAFVTEATPEMKILRRNRLDGTFKASPAVVDGRLLLRSERHLHSIGE